MAYRILFVSARDQRAFSESEYQCKKRKTGRLRYALSAYNHHVPSDIVEVKILKELEALLRGTWTCRLQNSAIPLRQVGPLGINTELLQAFLFYKFIIR
ncbi:hypothetical protein SAMN04487869_10116 [Marinobacter sp. DSM 26671]|nr:hypothetical protein SAMN04487869_10116 [Marinobacter sp. DSM 26671]